MWIGVIIAMFGQQWWTRELDRRLIVAAAALFCVAMGIVLVAIAAATGREEYGFGTLFGGNHGLRVLVLIAMTGLLGIAQLALGVHLARLAHRRAV